MIKGKLIKANTLQLLSMKIKDYYMSGHQTNLAIFSSTLNFKISNLYKEISNLGFDIFGSITFNNMVPESLGLNSNKSTLMMLIDAPKNSFRIRYFSASHISDDRLGQEIGASANVTFKNTGIILLGSGLSLNSSEIENGIYKTSMIKATNPFSLPDSNYQNAFVFTNDNISEYGILALFYNKDLIDLSNLPKIGISQYDSDLNIHEKNLEKATSILEA